MNLHPDILAQAAFLPRPGSYRELRDMVGLIEENGSADRAPAFGQVFKWFSGGRKE